MILILALFLLPLAAQAEIYKWVDEKGNIHYGDEPRGKGAERMRRLPGLSTYSPPPMPKEKEPADELGEELRTAEPAPKPQPAYRQLKLVGPEDGATVRSSPGEVPVFVAVDPVLREGDYIRVILDGNALPERHSSTVIRLQNVDRGEHKVAVAVYSKDGRKLLQSDAHTFYLHRTIARKPVPRGG